MARGRDAIQEAAEIMVALVDKDPRIYEKIVKQAPTISYNLLATLERVGRGQIYGALLFDSSPGARRLLAMPYGMQKEYYEKPLRVVSVQNGKKVVNEKTISQLTPAEVRTTIADDHIRNVEEQSKLVEVPVVKRGEPPERFTILPNGNLLILANTEFTPARLQEVYERVTAIAVRSLKTKPGSS